MDGAQQPTPSKLKVDEFPQEIIDNIVKYVDKPYQWPGRRPDDQPTPRLSILATVLRSRKWQAAVEAHTFASLIITTDEFDDFFTFLSTDTRRRYVRSLYVAILLPDYSDQEASQYENSKDRKTNDLSFTHSVSKLLSFLSDWPSDANFHVRISAHAPLDKAADRRVYWQNALAQEYPVRPNDIFEDRHRYSYLHLGEEFNSIGPVPCVTTFEVGSWSKHWHIDPCSLISFAAAFPCLRRVELHFTDHDQFLGFHDQYMSAFARRLDNFQLPASCRALSIAILQSRDCQHREALSYLKSSDKQVGLAVCDLVERSKHLQEFGYVGSVDSEFFWPSPEDEETLKSWGRLEEINIYFELDHLGLNAEPQDDDSVSEASPEFDPVPFPPGYYETQIENRQAAEVAARTSTPLESSWDHAPPRECQSRLRPDYSILFPIIKVFARRLAHTPTIKKASLTCRTRCLKGTAEIIYCAPDQRCGWDEDGHTRLHVSEPRVYVYFEESNNEQSGRSLNQPPVHVPDDDEELVAELEAIGRKWHGMDTTIMVPYYRTGWGWQGLE